MTIVLDHATMLQAGRESRRSICLSCGHQDYARCERRDGYCFPRLTIEAQERCRVERGYFIEDCEPCGAPDTLRYMHSFSVFGGKRYVRDDVHPLREFLTARVHGHQHLAVIWEPLPTPAPGPEWTQPYCCYVRHIVFYHRPYTVVEYTKTSPDGPGEFAVWDRLDYALSFDDMLAFEGETWRVGGGTVVWRQGRWWMRHGARRERVAARLEAVQ